MDNTTVRNTGFVARYNLPKEFKLTCLENCLEKIIRLSKPLIFGGIVTLTGLAVFKFTSLSVITLLSSNLLAATTLIATAAIIVGIVAGVLQNPINRATDFRRNVLSETNPGSLADFIQKNDLPIKRQLIRLRDIYHVIRSDVEQKTYAELIDKWSPRTFVQLSEKTDALAAAFFDPGFWEDLKNKFQHHLKTKELNDKDENPHEVILSKHREIIEIFFGELPKQDEKEVLPEPIAQLIAKVFQRQNDVRTLSYSECMNKWGDEFYEGLESSKQAREKAGAQYISELDEDSRLLLADKYKEYFTIGYREAENEEEFLAKEANVILLLNLQKEELISK
jgi:hypothetical protein